MNDKAVIAGLPATQDVEEAVKYFRSATNAAQSQRFVDALEEAYQHIARLPGTGSPRYGHQLRIAGLRSWPVKGFPYVVLYTEQESNINVHRILHTARDIPASLTEGMED